MHVNIFFNYHALLTHEASFVLLPSDGRILMLNNKHIRTYTDSLKFNNKEIRNYKCFSNWA